MAELLIHSMSEFENIIIPCLERAKAQHIVEIGAEFGGMSNMLAQYCTQAGGKLTSIDPSPKDQFLQWVAGADNVRHIAKPSLEAIPDIDSADAWIVDGDHNHYTVIRELRAIDKVCSTSGRPFLAFLHDVSWPWARRDLYYAPEQIPEEHRHDYSYEAGVHIETSEVLINRGFRGLGQFAIAIKAGGEKNGVLTAVEDFIAEADSEERPLIYAQVPAVFGLGVIFDGKAEWAEDIATFLMPYHNNELMAKLEHNRLLNFLKVIEWQDAVAASRKANASS